jgi:DmsE family decaheme c-type cytochrome
LLLALALFLLTGQAAAKQDQASKSSTPQTTVDASQYVGSDTCKTCHEDLYKNFEASPHFKTLGVKKWGPDRHGCEACHGPGKAHVDAGGDPTKIINPKNLSVAASSERCQTCHMGLEHSNFNRSAHLTNGVACISCHDPHHAADKEMLLVKSQPALCYSCHGAQKADFSKPFHHRVNEGLVECTDCHNEHGGFVTRQLRSGPAGDYVCFKCHAEKKGPFTFEHVPVKSEGCTMCHTPHGSVNPRLLRVSSVNLLCLQCHTPTPDRPVSSVGGIPGIPTFHNQNQKYQACTMCHTQIHGSNFDQFFFR